MLEKQILVRHTRSITDHLLRVELAIVLPLHVSLPLLELWGASLQIVLEQYGIFVLTRVCVLIAVIGQHVPRARSGRAPDTSLGHALAVA